MIILDTPSRISNARYLGSHAVMAWDAKTLDSKTKGLFWEFIQ